jgi:UDP-N-acetylmuramoyl-L-alanyl-D-glutamate--2,6-diaminopimelate ligase
MILQQLLQNIATISIVGNIHREIHDFCFDSRQSKENSLFVAVKGTQVDGHEYISVAIEKGASVILCENLPENLQEKVTYIQVKDSAEALALVAANFYGNPAKKLKIIGITGTNGKTSTATLLHNCFNQLGYKSGLISTISYKIGETEYAASHTTPDPKQLHKCFADMWENDCEYCFMEVSSHALVQKRTAGIPFKIALFTNITHDHLDYHGTFAEYIRAKKLLFDGLDKEAVAIVNVDDKNGNVMVQNCKGTVKKFAIKRLADYHCRLIENTFEGLLLEIGGIETWFRLVGSFNAYNLLGVFAVMKELGIETENALQVLSAQPGVNGRFEAIFSPELKITAIVDYAHTPDALKNVLETITDINQTRGNILTVIGCGGNRDKEKRPKMANIASEFSHQVILTSDNPRNENPNDILAQMYAGISLELRRKVMQIENRKEAIKVASRLAKPYDIILIAGKGHETYQEIMGVKYSFDDKEEIRNAFEELKMGK